MLENVKKRLSLLEDPPTLAVVLVGDNPASYVYVNHKKRACAKVGILSKSILLPADTTQNTLQDVLGQLNHDPKVAGILLQLPLPSHLNANQAIDHISPKKDVDGLHPENLGLLFARSPRFIPCTPKGCMHILTRLMQQTNDTLKGKHAVVVGRSTLVGRPLSSLLLRHHATVTTTHRYTKNLHDITKQADILIAATGVPGLITEKHVKKGAIVLDVGITRVGGLLKGDVDFDTVAPLCSFITPVPGGIGPMTVACLMENVVENIDSHPPPLTLP